MVSKPYIVFKKYGDYAYMKREFDWENFRKDCSTLQDGRGSERLL